MLPTEKMHIHGLIISSILESRGVGDGCRSATVYSLPQLSLTAEVVHDRVTDLTTPTVSIMQSECLQVSHTLHNMSIMLKKGCNSDPVLHLSVLKTVCLPLEEVLLKFTPLYRMCNFVVMIQTVHSNMNRVT